MIRLSADDGTTNSGSGSISSKQLVAVYENQILGVVEKEVTVGASEQVSGLYKNGNELVDQCAVAANFDGVCVKSCPLDSNGLQLSVIDESNHKCKCAYGSIIRSRTITEESSKTTEKYCGCADGSVFDPI